MERILVTGGSGFIGSKIVDTLRSNYHVSVIDKDSTDSVDEYYSFDISRGDWIENLPTDYDYIIHCAAQTGGYYSLQDPQTDCLWNSLGTLNVTSFSKKCPNLKKIIYTSSMAVYGNALDVTEDSLPSPISYYGASKLSGEYYVRLCWEHSRVPYSILRLWNTYGSGQDLDNKYQGMLSIYLAQALKCDVIEITGSEKRIRDFVHVDDVVNAVILCLNNSETDNQIVNVCCGDKISSKDVIREISNQLDKNLTIKEIDGYIGDQDFISGCNNKLKSFGWNPNKNLKSGIFEFLQNL